MRESLVVPLWTGKCRASIAFQDKMRPEILVFGKKWHCVWVLLLTQGASTACLSLVMMTTQKARSGSGEGSLTNTLVT